MEENIEEQAERLIHKLKHYLITKIGRLEEATSNEEFYAALAYTLKEELMVNWAAAVQTYQQQNPTMVYYLSMEYLPGRILKNNITNLAAHKVVEMVCKKMERDYQTILRQELEPGLGNGGLGRLASCFLDSMATLHIPSFGYGLRYQYGTFEQELWNGIQIERPDGWLLHPSPWEFRRDFRDFTIKYGGTTINNEDDMGQSTSDLYDYEAVRAIAYDTPIVGYSENNDFTVTTLRLWSTKESPRNFKLQRFNAGLLDQAAENMTLTDVLYPNDNHEMGKRMRLKQEFLLVSASLQDILRRHLCINDNLKNLPDKVRIQINDTHPALIIPELIRILITHHQFTWDDAFETTRHCMNYTNHTIMKEALEEWNEDRLKELLPRQYDIIEKLNQQFCDTIRKKYPGDEERLRSMSFIESGQVKMAPLAIYGSMHVNGVAELHSSIIKERTFKEFYEMYPEKFLNVTNGVTPRRWLINCNPDLKTWIDERIGIKWRQDFYELKNLSSFASDTASQESFLQIKKKNKEHLLQLLFENNQCRNDKGFHYDCIPHISTDALFDMQIKRIHEYKRQMLTALHLIMLYQELSLNPESRKISRMVLFGGKAAPGYETAKHIIQMIHCIAKKINSDEAINPKLTVIFVENYNVSKAEIIIPASDLSEQISTAGYEASGTGNMKLSMNGAMTIGTEDGANIEMRQEVTDQWWPFSFGCSAEEIRIMKEQGSYYPIDLCIHNTSIKQALDALEDGTFASNEMEHYVLQQCRKLLLEPKGSHTPDHYFVLKDLAAYYETQKKVEELYLNPNKWAEYAIHNIAGMGKFSADTAIKTYVDNVWKIQSQPIDPKILENIRKEYSEYDHCRINFNHSKK